MVGTIAHSELSNELGEVLLSSGWEELSPTLSFKELVLATEYLDDVFSGGSADGNVSYFDGTDFVTLKPTTLQFFYDLYGFGSSDEPADVLVSYISESDSQEYTRYSGADTADVQDFFQAIHSKPAFVFQGTFSPLRRKDGTTRDVSWLRRQNSLNGICVDIDGAEFFDGKHPIDAETLGSILELIPSDLTPTYVCLTGNGIHLWYVFSSPIQTYSRNTIRQRKLRALTTGLYRVYTLLLEGLDATPDEYCASLNHCFRAPGSLTKNGDIVRCFCRRDAVFMPSGLSVVELSEPVAEFLGSEFSESNVLKPEEAIYRTPLQIAEDHAKWVETRANTPATEAQLEFIHDLEDAGMFRSGELEDLENLSLLNAQNLIRKAVSRRGEGGKVVGQANDYSEWSAKPHWLVAGETGGVYNTVYSNITRVKPGSRYLALHMLAGVAYMMVNPEKTLDSLRDDFMGLLKTPWARAGIPLTERDMKNALLGYNPDNRQSFNSIVKALGFNPFGEPAKRNGRTREAHLALVHEQRTQKTAERVAKARKENPGANKSEIALALELTRKTVRKYWDGVSSSPGTASPQEPLE